MGAFISHFTPNEFGVIVDRGNGDEVVKFPNQSEANAFIEEMEQAGCRAEHAQEFFGFE